MATPRDIRKLAFQILYQIDAQGGIDADALRAAIDEEDNLRPAERDKILSTATAAWEGRGDADAAMLALAPDWPAHRMPVVDRCILRLAHHEMTREGAAPKAIINEAVELAKAFSTERSPAFVNALLDKVMKQLRDTPRSTATESAATETAPAEEA